MALDEAIFPTEMLMTRDDYEHLASISGSILVVATEGGRIVGAAFGFPADAVETDVRDNDPVFQTRPGEFYSYSVGVSLRDQGRGLGSRLVNMLALEAKRQGWGFLSTHVRVRKGWASTMRALFEPTHTRIVREYWKDPQELMEYQLVDLSKL